MRWILPASAILAFVIVTGGGRLYYSTTPQHALEQIERALDTRDPRLFEKHVDVMSVLDAAVDDLLAASATDAAAAATDVPLRDSTALQLKPVLTAMARDALITELVSGDVVASSFPAEDSSTLAQLTNHTSLGWSALRHVEAVERDGRRARARIRVQETALDTTLTLTLALEQRGGTWTFVGVMDLADYIRTVGELQQRRLAEERALGHVYRDWSEYLEARRPEPSNSGADRNGA